MEDWRELGKVGYFPPLFAQWRCTLSGHKLWPPRPPLYQLSLSGEWWRGGLPLSGEGMGGGREGGVKRKGAQEKQTGMFPEETESTKQRKRKRRRKKQAIWRDGSCIICACLTGAPQEECALLWWLNSGPTINDLAEKLISNSKGMDRIMNEILFLIHLLAGFMQSQFNQLRSLKTLTKLTLCFLLWFHVLTQLG